MDNNLPQAALSLTIAHATRPLEANKNKDLFGFLEE